MTRCVNCKWFEQNQRLAYLGSCGWVIHMPVPLRHMFSDVISTTVRIDDSCTLGVEPDAGMTQDDYEALYGRLGQG